MSGPPIIPPRPDRSVWTTLPDKAPQAARGEEKPLPSPIKEQSATEPISSKSLIGRANDPRKSRILSDGLMGRIYRLVLTVTRRGDKIKEAQSLASHFDLQDKAELTQHIKQNAKRLRIAPRVADYHSSSKGVPQAQLPKDRSLAAWKEAFEKKPIMNKPLAAKTHVDELIAHLETEHSDPPERLESLDEKGWTGYRISVDKGHLTTVEGHVSATSERNAGTNNHADLHNIYVHISDTGHITVTTAVIDTPRRAEQFMQAVVIAMKQWQKENPERELPPLRIAMHQLNTHLAFGPIKLGEAGLIEGQNRMATYMNNRLPEVFQEHELPVNGTQPYIIHKNHAVNATAAVPGEAGLARKNNLQGTVGQMLWLGQEVSSSLKDAGYYAATLNHIAQTEQELAALELLALPKDEIEELNLWRLKQENPFAYEHLHTLRDTKQDLIDEIGELRGEQNHDPQRLQAAEGELAAIETEIEQIESSLQSNVSKQELKEIQKSVGEKRELLNKQLKDLLEAQKQIVDNPHVYGIKEGSLTHERLMLATVILADQLDKSKFRHTQFERVALDMLLDEHLEATTQTNCKSSCDRTAIARALTECIGRITNQDGTPATFKGKREFIMNFEKNVRAMDKAFKDSPYETMNRFIASSEGKQYQHIHRFQVEMFAQLMAVGLPVTGRSTGLEGFKWHHDVDTINKNYHPLQYIPAEVWDEDSQRFIKLVTTDSSGKRHMTEEGKWILMGNAQGRGA